MAGLYLHIPFCKQACYYCDFHFSTDISGRREIIEAMARELTLQSDYLHEVISTIYFGGGTPSLLTAQEIDFLFDAIRQHFHTEPGEVTLEANPDDLTKEKAKALKRAGINRLSIGIQSFDDSLLRFLNRAHTASVSRECLQVVINHSPEHISAYALTVEDRTVFGNWQKRGKLHPMGEEDAARQFEILMDVLGEAGYEQYEISNFCKRGFHARHNSNYWNQSHYLGVGPSAHSYNGACRQFNVRNNALYVRSINQGKVPFELETLTPENKINEFILTGLRTQSGCNLYLLRTVLNDDLLSRCGEYIGKLTQEGLATLTEGTLRLTRKGKLLADKISEDLMISA
jgi:oxygen-independent coproporphyrinogen-3 oxidase